MSEIKALARGLSVLDFVWNATESVGVGELAEVLEIDKSSASRLAHTLIQYGYLAHAAGTRKLIPGDRLIQMSCEIDHRLGLRERARPYLEQLAEATGECAHMAVHANGMALVIEDVQVATSLRVVGGVGRRIAMHCTAVGKALLAFGNLPLPDPLTQMMPKTIGCPLALARHLDQIRAQGYAFDDEEHEPGVRCMAAPLELSGTTIAVIGISGPASRITDQRLATLAELLVDASGKLSQELLDAFRRPGKKMAMSLQQSNVVAAKS